MDSADVWKADCKSGKVTLDFSTLMRIHRVNAGDMLALYGDTFKEVFKDMAVGKDELRRALTQHAIWLKSAGRRGNRLDLSNRFLNKLDNSNADMRCAMLRDAQFIEVNMAGTNLSGAELSGALICGSNMRGANLTHANLGGAALNADLSGAQFVCSNCSYTGFDGSKLNGTVFNRVNMIDASLSGTNFGKNGEILIGMKPMIGMACPESGRYIGYKAAVLKYNPARYRAHHTEQEVLKHLSRRKPRHVIIELEIPADARRSSALSNRCRCSCAKVLSITSLDGSKHYRTAISMHDNGFTYRVGKVAVAENFDPDRWAEARPGIHHFTQRECAVNYAGSYAVPVKAK